MKDQSAILEKETKQEKWERGRCLFLESLYKPDNELLEIRDVIIDLVREMDNPHKKLKPGDKNNLPPVKSINGISVVLLRGALGKHYMKDWSEEHKKEWEEYVSINS